jgi:hypothetical protein
MVGIEYGIHQEFNNLGLSDRDLYFRCQIDVDTSSVELVGYFTSPDPKEAVQFRLKGFEVWAYTQ